MNLLTEKQRETLCVMLRFQRKYGYPPTQRELVSLLRLHSTNSVRDRLSGLYKKRFLRHERRAASRGTKLRFDVALIPLGVECGWRCPACKAKSFVETCGNPACPTKGTAYGEAHGLL